MSTMRTGVEFVLKVAKRAKGNGGYIYRCNADNTKTRVSLADFVITECEAMLIKYAPEKSQDQSS